MAIKGMGTDIVEIARIQDKINKSGDKLAQRVLTPQEYEQYLSHRYPERFLAKRFAAKEAAAKALGTGIGRGVSFQHIHVGNNKDGAPALDFSDGAALRMASLKANIAHISIADEQAYAVATVILEE